MDIPKIKKEISLFINSEEAKILKKDIAKLGLAASVIAGIMAQAQNSQAVDHTDSSAGHDNSTGPHNDHTAHSSETPHSNNPNHTNCHSDALGQHNSQAVYDDVENKGGHNSHLEHLNSHCDATPI